ncbi:acyl-CoA thioesterase [Actinomycetospora sp. CA-084318]|uniref:acyl-CoA thioesterase n=1 Tax=Actinomycetospora sp. CA-084318 TaxID=3239892 RepID=UPI003D964665
MSKALDELVGDVLDLEPIERDIFRGRSPQESLLRVFGGQVAGQAMVAAGRTVEDDRGVHSLHGYFLRPGDPFAPIVYEVDRTRDGRSFTTRRVTAVQHGETIFTMSASFQRPEEGVEHQAPMPDTPGPDGLPRRDMPPVPADRPAFTTTGKALTWPLDVRYVDHAPWDDSADRPPRNRVWIRADGELPDPSSPGGRLLHVCVLTYASDLTLLEAAVFPHVRGGAGSRDVSLASLDHAVWFHRPFRADDWLLYVQESPNAGGGRGLASGRLYRADGTLVASVVQEGLIRRRRPE